MKLLVFVFSAALMLAVEPARELVAMAKKSPQSAAFKEKLMALTKEPDRKAGRGWSGYLGEYVFAVDTSVAPSFFFDEAPGGETRSIERNRYVDCDGDGGAGAVA